MTASGKAVRFHHWPPLANARHQRLAAQRLAELPDLGELDLRAFDA